MRKESKASVGDGDPAEKATGWVRRTWLRHRRRPIIHYDAFMSYSHAIDRGLAPGIRAGLQKLGRPWYLRAILRVFLDQQDLGANPSLWRTIRRNIIRSRNFVLLASPAAARSEWVHRELRLWIRLRGTEQIYIALTDGTLPWSPPEENPPGGGKNRDALPPVLAKHLSNEPKWIDFREVRDDTGFRRDNSEFREALAGLAGPLHRKPKTPGQLISEDYKQHRRTISLAVTVMIALAALATWSEFNRRTVLDLNRQKDRQLQIERGLRAEMLIDQGRPLQALETALLAVKGKAEDSSLHAPAEVQQALGGALVSLRSGISLTETENPVATAALSSDGRTALLVPRQGPMQIYDAKRGLLRNTIPRLGQSIRQLELSPDGSSVLILPDDAASVVELVVADGKRLNEYRVNREYASAFMVDRANGRLFVWGAGRFARLQTMGFPDRADRAGPFVFDLTSGEMLYTFHGLNGIAIAPDERHLWVTNFDGEGALIDFEPKRIEHFQKMPVRVVHNEVNRAEEEWSRLDDKIHWARRSAACGSDGRVVWADAAGTITMSAGLSAPTNNGEALWTRQHGAAAFTLFTWSPDDQRVAAGAFDGSVLVLESGTGDLVHRIPPPVEIDRRQFHVLELAWSPDGGRLLIEWAGGGVAYWDVRAKYLLREWPDRLLEGVSRSHDRLLLSDSDGDVRLVDHTGRLPLFRAARERIVGAAAAPGKTYVVDFADDAKHLELIDVETGAPAHRLPFSGRPASAALHPGGSLLVVGGMEGGLFLFDLGTGEPAASIRFAEEPDRSIPTELIDHMIEAAREPDRAELIFYDRDERLELPALAPTPRASALAFSPDGKTLAVGTSLGQLVILDHELAAEPEILKTQAEVILAVRFSSDGSHVFATGKSGELSRLDVASRAAETIYRHGGAIAGLAIAPHDTQIVIGAADGNLRTIDGDSGELENTFFVGGGLVRLLAVAPDGRRLASGSEDRIVRVHDLASGAVLQELEAAREGLTYLTWIGPNTVLYGNPAEARVAELGLDNLNDQALAALKAFGRAPSAK